MAMDRRSQRTRRTGSILLLFLALVSIAAPVLADSYLCPMARAASEHTPTCCDKTPTPPERLLAGIPQFQEACHCPQLSWGDLPSDQVRDLRTSPAQVHLFAVLPSWLVADATPSKADLPEEPRRIPIRTSFPLWLLHQSFLC